MKILITEHQLNILVEGYSDKLIKNLISRFIKEGAQSEDLVRDIIDKFSQIKDSVQVSEKDITKYSWNELFDTVIGYTKNKVKAGKENKDDMGDANLVYMKNGLRVYKAESQKACIKYGNKYSFCISSRSRQNKFSEYAFDSKGTIYFVFDDTKTNKVKSVLAQSFVDPTHLLVVVVYDNGKDYPVYTVTDADNYETVHYPTYQSIVNRYPRLGMLYDVIKSSDLSLNPEYKLYNLNKEYNKKIENIKKSYLKNPKLSFFEDIVDSNKWIDKYLKMSQADNCGMFFVSLVGTDGAYDDEGLSDVFIHPLKYTKKDEDFEKRTIAKTAIKLAYPEEDFEDLNEYILIPELLLSGDKFLNYLNDIKKTVDDYRKLLVGIK